MFFYNKFWLIFGTFVAIFIVPKTYAGTTPFSQYGMIQNVQNYSGNPFYNANSYVATYPKIVYATGPALKPGDCERTVSSLIENICASRNNCRGTTLADIRPTAMIQLSTLSTTYNYATSCSGYIDDIYNQYMKQYAQTPVSLSTSATFPTVFPNGTSGGTTKQSEYDKRAAELKDLQAQTKTSTDSIQAAAFPKTFSDLSFAQQNEIKRQGYELYKDAQTYIPLNIERDPNAYKTAGEAMCTEAGTILACIQGYDTQEQAAEKKFEDFCNKSSPTKANFSDKNSEAFQISHAVSGATSQACGSVCVCSKNSRLADTLQKTLNITCDADFVKQCESMGLKYMEQLIKNCIASAP